MFDAQGNVKVAPARFTTSQDTEAASSAALAIVRYRRRYDRCEEATERGELRAFDIFGLRRAEKECERNGIDVARIV
jgi:hypothetical protein